MTKQSEDAEFRLSYIRDASDHLLMAARNAMQAKLTKGKLVELLNEALWKAKMERYSLRPNKVAKRKRS